jgi:predicted kinase
MAERAYIFDCIEFNTRFRFSDTAADLAFILMDLEYRGRRDFATILFHEYLDVTKDRGVVELLDFYRIYRAFVRGKVESFRLDDSRIGVEEKEAAAKIARRYFRLARGYILRRELSPRLIVFSGLMGTGKSTLARELSFELGLDMITSDILRKELAGLSKTERRWDEYNEGIYTADFTGKTYGEMFRRAEDILRKGQSVILDASFSRKEERFRAMDLARKTGAEISFFRAVCSDETVRERLRERESDTSEPSDGRWELYSRQKRDFDPFVSPLEKCGEVDTSLPVEENTVRILQVMGVSSK